jgi:hypothetical protein
MASDYTIIMWVRHRFGVDETSEAFGNADFVLNEDSNAPFVGLTGEFPFSCPRIDSAQGAVLQFEYRGSSQGTTFPDPQGAPGTAIGITPEYPVKINGQLIAGGVPGAPVSGWLPMWSTRVLLVDKGVLQEENILRIEASVDYGGSTYEDKFTIDNVVIFFKTKTANPRPDPGPVKG